MAAAGVMMGGVSPQYGLATRPSHSCCSSSLGKVSLLRGTDPGQGCLLGVAGWEPLWKGTCSGHVEQDGSTEECQGRAGGANKVDGEGQNWCPPVSGRIGLKEGKKNGGHQCFHTPRKFLHIPAPLVHAL